MKRILSLFLSLVLVFSTITGTIVAEASSTEPIKLVKAIDTTGRNYDDYKSEITEDIWSYSYVNQVAYADDASAFNLTFTRSDKQSAFRIVTSPIGAKATSGVHTVSYKILADNDTNSDGNVDFARSNIVVNRVGSSSSVQDGTFSFPTLQVNRWYEFKIVFDLDATQQKSTMEVIDVASGEVVKSGSFNVKNDNGYTNMWMYLTYTAGTQARMLFKDVMHISDYGDMEKASITSVGSDGSAVIPHSQNKVRFTLDRELPGLTKDSVLVKSRQGGSDITASEITITSDAAASNDAQWIVTATLSQDLAAWTDYNIAISKDYYAGYKEVTSSGYIDVTDITAPFSTPSAPLDIRAPQFDTDGSAATDVISSYGNTDMTFVYTNTASEGYIKEITSKDFSVNGTLNGASISFDNGFESGDTAKLFVINSWTDPTPLFNKYWSQSYDGSIPEADAPVAAADAAPGEMTFGEFDYTDKKITVNLNVGSDAGATDGILYIYKRGTSLKDNLIYADYVTTTADGSLAKEVKFADDINATTGEYTAAFYADGITLTNDFPIYDEAASQAGDIGYVDYDLTGKDVVTGYGSVVIGSTYSYYPGYAGNYANFIRFANATAVGTVAIDGETVVAHRANKSGGDGTDGYFTVYFSNEAVSSPGSKTSGKYVISGRLWAINNVFSSTNMTFDRNGANQVILNPWTVDNPIKAQTWYDFELVVDLDAESGDNLWVTVTEDAPGGEVFSDSARYNGTSLGSVRVDWDLSDKIYDNYIAYDDFRLISYTGESKPVIRYIGANGVVDYGQNEITFKISENNGLTKDNIAVQDAQGNVIKAKSISVTEDMGEYVITATMEKDLSSWKTYTLMVDAIGYENYVELDNGRYVAVKPISRTFTTPEASIDIKDPVITSDGSSVTFDAEVKNDTQSSVNATTVLTVVNSDGIMQNISTDNNAVNKNTEIAFTNTNDFSEGDTAKLFVIEDFANPVQLFDKTWSVNYDGTIPAPAEAKASAKAGAKAMVLDEYDFDTKFDHENKKICVNLNTGANGFANGVLYVYSGDAMGEDNLPIYADYITTAADGTLAKEIKFADDITDTSENYTVAFYSKDSGNVIKSSFDVYEEADFLEYKRSNIFERAQAASTFSGLMQVITGTDEDGKTVNEAWTIFSADADTDVYESLNNKQNVYISLITSVKSLSDYSGLCDEFEKIALAQQKKENSGTSASSPSSNNKNTGGSSVSMSATPSQSNNNAGTAGGTAVFADMAGHWAQKHAEALAARGIVNGYDDGSFRGDNSISRAELAKIIVEAFNIAGASDNSFTDVNASSWYYSYVSRAAAAGVVNGTGNGTFAPDNNVSRQDAVLMIYRAMNLTTELPAGYKFFADEKDIQDYASDAIRCLGDLGIITGTEDSRFLPLNSITRAEMAAVICRSLDYLESHLQ